MKTKTYIIRLLSLVLLAGMHWAFHALQDRHVGKWVGKAKGEVGFLILDQDGYATIEINGQVFGGRESVRNGELVNLTYTIDYFANPISIDFVLSEVGSNREQGRFRGIIEFKHSESMLLALEFNSARPRPADFNRSAITLERVR